MTIVSKQQLNAISHKNGPALVLSVPGSGKTTVLLNRIIYLIDTHNIKYNQILNLTFSKIQAMDMKERFKMMAGNTNVSFYTIHSFAYSIIKQYCKKNKINITLIEGSNKYNKNRLINRLHFEEFGIKITTADLESFFSNYSLLKNNMLNINEFTNITDFSNLAIKYEEFKSNNKLIDFDDMLTFAYAILNEDKDILNLIKSKFTYIQLDEGQDASLIQFKLLELIASPENNIFILADDDQSIYSFRGAKPDYLLNIKNIYDNITFYNLNKNYRSTKDIVMLSNYIIKNNKERYYKDVESNSIEKTPIQIVKVKNLEFQNKFILEKISEFCNENENIAILFRNNISAYAPAFILNNENLKFNKRLNFNNKNLNIVLDDLKNIINFSKNQNNLGFFKAIYYKLNLYLKKDYIENIYIHNYDSILKYIINDSYIKEYQRDLIKDFKISANKIIESNLTESLKIIFQETGYLEYISKRFDNIPINFIKELLIYTSNNYTTIEELIEFFNNLNINLSDKLMNDSKIYISTIHQSKGLEYDNVILIDLVDGEFPIYSDKISNIEEERRLFYVAITRAKKRLYLVSPKFRGNKKVKPSKFYTEIKNLSK
ncbi:ATP-dependent helicase [Miniphocaeibacter massiliensis]|uniref:ATP-dependent helicase n=1 Tax=Miniphocaeibacter massiliensis TaxID=2041841 RepID=UPI000C067EE7|nr:ATP-dependent helicase [Miniphocaeibacter massiliensis]